MEIFLLLTFLHFFALPFPTYVTAVPSQTSSSYINIELRQEVDAPEAVRRWIEWSPLINQADMISSDWKAWATTDLCLFLRQSGAQASLDPDAYVRGSVASLEYERHTLVELSFYPRLRNYRISDFFAVIRRGVRKLRQSNLQVPFHDYRRYMIAVASGLGMMVSLVNVLRIIFPEHIALTMFVYF